MRKLTFLFYLTFLIPNIVTGNLVEIYSLDQMDDPRLFCIDIRGHKSKAKTNLGLQAHTVTHTKVALPLIRVLTYLSWIKANFVYLPLMCVWKQTQILHQHLCD